MAIHTLTQHTIVLALFCTVTLWSQEASRELFDGKSLSGWQGNGDSWSVRDGAITGEIPAGKSLGHNEFLFHQTAALGDFVLELEYRISGHATANSGIQIRSRPHGTEAVGYQADLDDGATWLGRIYEEGGRALLTERGTTVTIDASGQRHVHTWASPQSFQRLPRLDSWRRYRIQAAGPRLETYVDDQLHSVLEDHEVGALAATGQLALQLHSGPGPALIQFRRITLWPLAGASVPATAPPSRSRATGLAPPGRNLDFEAGTLAGWKLEGDAWKGQPIQGDTVAPRRPGQRSGHDGQFWLGTYEVLLDAPTGVLTSEPFPVTHPWASFLVGGGAGKDTRVEILAMPAANVVFTANGKEIENLRRVTVDLRSFEGQSIAIRIVDASSGPWGHINFDDFRFHAEAPAGGRPDRIESSPVLRHLTPNPSAGEPPPGQVSPDGIQGAWVPPGFRVDLVAREPEVTQPVAFAIDERGRLWVLEAHSYPQRRQQGLDRVLVFADADGDGSFESRKVFATGLNLASAIEVGFGGVWVGAAPYLLFFPDRNGDDVPDGEPEVLLDGWGFQDTHETLNSFLWGPDGWLYGNQGVFTRSSPGKPGTPNAARATFNAGVWRFHPVTHAFEVFAHGGSNQWGLDYNPLGDLFMTHCRSAWGEGSTTHVVRGGHYWNQANSGHAAFVSAGPPGFAARADITFKNFLLASARYDHGEGGAGKPGSDVAYGGHSHVGTMIYLGDNWPESYRGHLFTHNLHGHQINRQMNVPDGSGYNTIHAGADPLYVADPRYIAVDLQYGPDGSVFIIDWSDTQHCHHTTIENWDRTNGRIYRLAWTPTWKPGVVNLQSHSDRELIDLLGHANAWFSRTARRLLQERAAAGKLEPASRSTLASLALAGGEPTLWLSRLWAAHVTRSVDAALLERLLDANDEHVRAWAVRLACEDPASRGRRGSFAERARSETSPVVRLALASALQHLPGDEAWSVGKALSLHAEDAADRLLPGLIWYGLAPHVTGAESRALELARTTPLKLLADSIFWFLSLSPPGRTALVATMEETAVPLRARAIELMAFALTGKGVVEPPGNWPEAQARLARDAAPALASHLERLAFSFGDERALTRMRATLADRKLAVPERLEALHFLAQANDATAVELFVALLDEPAMRAAAIPLVGRFGDERAAEKLVQHLEQSRGEEQSMLANALSSRRVMAQALLDALAGGRVPRTIITSLQVRQIASLGNQELTARLEKVWGKVKASTADARKTVAKYRKLYADAPLWAHDPRDGAAIHAKVCGTCHALNGKGGNIGPDLGGSWKNGAEYFIESIVDPHAVVGEAFQLNVLVLADGNVLNGMVTQNGDTLTLLAPDTPARVIRQDEIQQRQITDQSVMPSGLLDTLSEKAVIDLLRFLTSKP